MDDFKFKEFSKEEAQIYDWAVEKLRSAIKETNNFDDACKMVKLPDSELKDFILVDFLKICIAELHYEQGKTMEQVANKLSVPLNRVMDTHREMVAEIEATAKAEYHRQLSKGEA